ncbi:MAG: hypothetical protein ACHRXM_33945 [Isosphaerales bacterium]
MAAANESQGLKIAVAAFITLTVILTVTSYFLYSNGASAEARLASEQEAHNTTKKGQSLAVNQYDEMRTKIGTKVSEFDPAKEEIVANFKKIEERLKTLTDAVNAAVQTAQQNGAQGPELEDAKLNVQKAITSFRNEPNKTYVSSLDRLTELMENMALLTTQLSLNYINVRHSLESATKVAKDQVDVQAKAAADSQAELQNEQKKHVDERGTLLTKVDTLQTESDKRQTEVLNLTQKLKQQEDDLNRRLETLLTMYREKRDQLERQELVLDRPDGYVTYVDYLTREVLVSLTRRMGARPQMKLTIFDAKSPGIPTEKPKGNIELTSVGEQFSTARIIKTNNSIDPIREGDIVYSAAWSPNQPMRFALVGKMDVNRDSRDDRAELKRMIEEAGGIVEFDLPPPDLGKETGTLSPRIDWYVIDTRMPIRDSYEHQSDTSMAQATRLQTRVGEVIKEARLNGIRPMTIERLLAYLGYDQNTPVVGRAEAVDNRALQRLIAPRHPTETQAKPAAETIKAEPKTDEAKPPAAEMKDDEPKDDQPKAKAATKRGRAAKAAAKKKAANDDNQPK